MLGKHEHECGFGAFSFETWDALQAIGSRLVKSADGQNPDDLGGSSGDREPRPPLPSSPLSGSVELVLSVVD